MSYFQKNNIKIISLVSFILLISILNFSFAQTFDVTVKGVSAGKASLAIDKNTKSYGIILNMVPNLLVRTFGIKNITEEVSGNIDGENYFPTKYTRLSGGKYEFIANFNGSKVEVNDKGKVDVNMINVLAQDPLTQILQIRTDLMNNKLKPNYFLLGKKDVTKYKVALEKSTNISKVILLELDKDRSINLSFDKNFKLVELIKIKDKKIDFKLKAI